MDAKETTIYLTILIIGFIIGVILGYFLWSIIRLHRRYIHLHKSKNSAQIAVLEKERTRIAADLHDELGPILSAVKFKLAEVEPPTEEEQILLGEAADHIDKIIARIREISNGLMPNTLLRKGPVHAIEEFIHVVTSSCSLKIELLPYNIPPLSQEQAINIYRILQEIIHNTVKHAGASWLKIQFFIRTSSLVIICTDNGSGFNKNAVRKEKTGLGMHNMLLRIEMLGGKMYVTTGTTKGTTVKFEIPLSHTIENNDESKNN